MATSESKKSKSTSVVSAAPEFGYSRIEKIVWGFADLVRDKGNGTTEDYAKVVIPTCLLKRTLDLQQEWLAQYGDNEFEAVAIGVDPLDVLLDVNKKSYGFFNSAVLSTPAKAPLLLLTWSHLVSFKDNPNGLPVTIALDYGQTYTTSAKTFVDLMFEVISCLNDVLQYVFMTFEFQNLIVTKAILPPADFFKTCKDELSSVPFTKANVSFDMFSSIYMNLVERFSHDSGKRGGEFFTPTPLVKAAWQFLDIEGYAKKLISGEKTTISIGDPTAGSNTFLIYGYDLIKEACDRLKPGFISQDAFQFYGQELKGFQYCLGLVNMVLHNTINQYNQNIGSFRNQNANVISEYFTGIGKMKGKLDVVVANPPYGTKDYGIEYAQGTQTSDDRWRAGIPLKSEGEFAFMQTILDLLNAQGKAVVILPLGTLFRGAGAVFRKAYLQGDVLEGVVTLPGNMFLTTSIPVALMIFNKNKADADREKVFMVNASKDFTKVGKFNEWHPEQAIEAYLSRTEIVDYSGYVDFATLEKNKFNFSVQRYFGEQAQVEDVDIEALALAIAELNQKLLASSQVVNPLIAQALTLKTEAL